MRMEREKECYPMELRTRQNSSCLLEERQEAGKFRMGPSWDLKMMDQLWLRSGIGIYIPSWESR
jgi:hypothetical protein